MRLDHGNWRAIIYNAASWPLSKLRPFIHVFSSTSKAWPTWDTGKLPTQILPNIYSHSLVLQYSSNHNFQTNYPRLCFYLLQMPLLENYGCQWMCSSTMAFATETVKHWVVYYHFAFLRDCKLSAQNYSTFVFAGAFSGQCQVIGALFHC